MAWRTHRLTWRLVVVIALLLVATGGIVARLVQVQILDHSYYAQQAEAEHLSGTVIRAPRGAILDRNGYPLVTTVSAFDVYIDPLIWEDDDAALLGAAAVGPLLGREAGELITSARDQEAGDYLAGRAVSANVGLQLMAEPPPGVRTVEVGKRFYPEGDVASELLGFIGQDETGLAGIEADFDRDLRGVSAEVQVERDGLGNPIPFGRRVGEQPVPGSDVYLTIDRYLQSLVDAKLEFELERTEAEAGTIIIMDPHTGEILAMSGRPSYQVTQLDLANSTVASFRNRAVTDVYPPGSVMKTVTMAGALEAGVVRPEMTFNDTGYAPVEGTEPIRNFQNTATGTITMTQILQYSVNVGAVWLSDVMGANRFYDNLARFGFGEPTHVGLSGEPAGLVVTPDDDGWYPVTMATNSFGQGISVTPLQMISAVASLVNGGQLMRPYIVKEVAGPDGRRVYEPVVVRRSVSEQTSRTLVDMMRAVVDGTPGHRGQVAGYSVGGKTGTSTIQGETGTYASFVGFAPAEDPQFIMLVVFDRPQSGQLGSTVAAPVFSDLAPQILAHLGVPPIPDEAYVEAPPEPEPADEPAPEAVEEPVEQPLEEVAPAP